MKYKKIDVSGLTRDEWLKLRKNSIGGSDASSVLGLNQYRSALEVWGDKVGVYEKADIVNQYTFTGIVLEPILRDIFRFWNGDKELSFKNYLAHLERERIRKAKGLDTIIEIEPVNIIENGDNMYYSLEFPYMSANLDGLIKRDYERKDEPGLLEVKTMNSWVYDKYEGGLPPDYFVQVQHSLAVTGYSYGRLFFLYDTNNYETYLFERDDEMIGKIIERERIFWDAVLEGRELIKNNQPYQHIEDALVDGSSATEDFIKKNSPNAINDKTIEGNPKLYKLIKNLEPLQIREKEIKEQQTYIKNIVRRSMQDAGVMDFGDMGKVTYKENIKGVRTLRISLI